MAAKRHQFHRGDAAEPDEPVSRSQRKRDSTAMQERGEKLAALSPAMRAKLPLPPELREALALFPSLSTHEARRRQLQYIGRLMREAEEEGTLQAVLDALALF